MVTSTGKFEVKMSKAHGVALQAALAVGSGPKTAMESAIAKTIGVAPATVTITAIYLDGVKIGRRLQTTGTDSTLRVEWQVTATTAVATAAMNPTTLKTNIEAKAAAAGLPLTLTELPSVTPTDDTQVSVAERFALPGAVAVLLAMLQL